MIAAESGVSAPQSQRKVEGGPVRADGIHYYPAGPVTKAYLNDDSFIVGIRGPFGSGKSTASIMKLIKNAQTQPASHHDGWRRRRTAIIRNTYPELRTTTMKSWHQWMPQHIGKWRESGPPCHRIIDERNKFDWEVLFVALDRPDDLAKLLSMDLSDAWGNEARELPKAVIDGLTGRVGRYPARWQAPCTNAQILLDTNSPDTDHWWYVLAENDVSTEKNRQLIASMREAEELLRLKGVLKKDQPLFKFYSQPSGREPHAENLRYLPPGYYEFLMAGKTEEFIKVYVDGEYGFVQDGKPIYPEYKDSTHSGEFAVVAGLGLRLGFDFGLTPACSISQRLPNGTWLVHDEYVSERMGITTFAKDLARFLAERYPGQVLTSQRGDPAGDTMNPDESTCFSILKAADFKLAEPAPTNDPVRRKEATRYLLKTMVDGVPALRIHKRCSTLRKAFAGAYCLKRLQVTGEDRYRDAPDKSKYSHIVEALEYDLVSAGEDRNVTVPQAVREHGQTQKFAQADWNEFGG